MEIGTGDELIVDEQDEITSATAIREVQRYFAQFADGSNWSDELIAARREDARLESESQDIR